jgi:hypothetical protein
LHVVVFEFYDFGALQLGTINWELDAEVASDKRTVGQTKGNFSTPNWRRAVITPRRKRTAEKE